MAQTSDGYLWLGSPDGLYRFDGVVFERYQPQSGGPLPARSVSSLLTLANGDLWIGFRTGGISLLRNGNVTNYSTRDGLPGGWVYSFVQDRDRTMWAATESGLARQEGDRWKEVGKDWNFPGKSARATFVDRQGTLWIATEDTLVFLPLGARRFQPTGIQVGQVYQIAQAANGKLWMAETTRSVRPIPLSDKRQPPDETEIRVGSGGILFDNDGALWITSVGDGLRRSPAPELLRGRIQEFSTAVESFTTKDGLSDDYVRAILQDREGNIWVGTNNGLGRFRKTNLVPVALPHKPWYSIFAAGDAGDLWVHNGGVIFRVHEGRVDPIHPFLRQSVSAYRDLTGAIWWFCLDAIYRNDAGKFTRIALPTSFPTPHLAGMRATEDGSGALWLAALREALFYRKNGRWQRLETAPELTKLTPLSTFRDWMGRAWFGYEGGTIILLDHESIERVFSADDSLVGSVRAINGRGRHTWVGGDFGLAFFDGSRFRRIVPTDPEAFGRVMGVEETVDGSLWLAETRGVIQVSASEVRQALDNPSYRVKYRMFNSLDGLSGAFEGTVNNPKAIQGTDGRIWFIASGGIVWIDPANISTNALPPPVLIRSVTANGKQPGSLANLVLPPRTTNVQIAYTALSLTVPERVHFRYKLDGVDQDWQDSGTRRTAFYTNLGPGSHHFQVIASNNDGVWNTTGAALDFSIQPAFYQTRWFLALCIVSALAVLYLFYLLRVRQVAQRVRGRMQERLDERERIARDLHDTLLQSVQGLMLKFQSIANGIPQQDQLRQKMENALDVADEVLREGRDRVRSLRYDSPAMRDLAAAFRRLAEEAAPDGATTVKTIVEGAVRELHPMVLEESYCIGREALINAIVHSECRQVEVEIIYDPRQFRLRVRDDGRGIDSNILEQGRADHWGLQGMRERANKFGGQLEIWSRPGSGTEVELRVPAAMAYRSPRARNTGIRFQKAAGARTD